MGSVACWSIVAIASCVGSIAASEVDTVVPVVLGPGNTVFVVVAVVVVLVVVVAVVALVVVSVAVVVVLMVVYRQLVMELD